MSFSRMDPSCTIGFYAKGQKEFESLCSAVDEVCVCVIESVPGALILLLCCKALEQWIRSYQAQSLSCLCLPQALSTTSGTYPMFIFAEGKRQEEEQGTAAPVNDITYIQRKSERRRVDTCNSMDEFVLL